MSTRSLEKVTFTGPAGIVEGLLHLPAEGPTFAAVVSHPHPLHGGTMDNRVVYRVARALEEAGGLVLRFNFRGAGDSEGTHDEGRGEQDDLRAAIAFLRSRGGEGLPLLLAGFSFGAVMSALVATRERDVDALLLVGVPLGTRKLPELAGYDRPVAFVHGRDDEHGSIEQVRELQDSLDGSTVLHVVDGTGHFFEDRQNELYETVRDVVLGGSLGEGFSDKRPEA